jgi:hypothetical protein
MAKPLMVQLASGRCRKSIGLMTAALLALPSSLPGRVQAQDDAGVHAFFAAESSRSGRSLAPSRSVLPFTARSDPPTGTGRPAIARQFAPRWHAGAPLRPNPAPRLRYASLPKADKQAQPRKGTSRPKPAGSEAVGPHVGRTPKNHDPIAALLHDPTLERGDIVVLDEGAKVFKGVDGGSVHHWSEFEDVQSSRAVPKTTRKMVLALLKPAANPAKAPAMYLARTAVSETPPSDEARTASVRVVYPRFR